MHVNLLCFSAVQSNQAGSGHVRAAQPMASRHRTRQEAQPARDRRAARKVCQAPARQGQDHRSDRALPQSQPLPRRRKAPV